jgi:hypothetical protein
MHNQHCIYICHGGFQEKINLGDTSGGYIQLRGFNVGGATTASQLQMHTVLGNASWATRYTWPLVGTTYTGPSQLDVSSWCVSQVDLFLETSSHNPHIGGGRHIGSFLKNTNGKGKFSFLVYYTQIKKYINQMPSGRQLLIFSWFLYLNNRGLWEEVSKKRSTWETHQEDTSNWEGSV